MIKEAFATEETIALAKMRACQILGVDQEKADFEIIQVPEKKKFGIFGGKMAQVRAYIKENPIERAKSYIKELLYYMGFESLEVESECVQEGLYLIKIEGKDIKYIVGHHGETLDAIEYLCGFVANSGVDKEGYCKIRVEAGEYRDRRRKSLESYGRRKAYEIVKNGGRIDLEPMRSYERKIVHMAIKFIEGVQSWSEGQDNDRHVVILSSLTKRN